MQAGREPRPPWTWESIGTILQALVEGVGLRHRIDPASATDAIEELLGTPTSQQE